MSNSKKYNYRFDFFLKIVGPVKLTVVQQVKEKLQANQPNIIEEVNVFERNQQKVSQKSNGINREYFKTKKRGGFQLFFKQGLQMTDINVKLPSEFFMQHQELIHKYGNAEEMQREYGKITAKATLEDLKQIPQKRSSKYYMKEFTAENIANGPMAVKQYLYKNLRDPDAIAHICQEQQRFNNTHKILKEMGVVKKIRIAMRQQLENFVIKNKNAFKESDRLTDTVLKDLGYYDVAEALYQVLIKREDLMVHCVWLYGAINTGKSTILQMIDKIFICDEFNSGPTRFHVESRTLEQEPQVLLIDEMNIERLFHRYNIPAMKKLLEGKGNAVDRKYGETQVLYQDCYTVITTNDLPWNRMTAEEKDCFERRCIFVTPAVEGKSGKLAFPFNAAQLASYLLSRSDDESILSDNDQDKDDNIQQDSKRLSLRDTEAEDHN